MPTPCLPLPDRFWARVNKSAKGDCWEWTGCTNKKTGYGGISIGGHKTYVHIYSYLLHFGSIKEGLEVAHSCHNRVCVNPKHLRLLPHEANMEEMMLANRQAKGEKNTNALTTNAIASQIRKGWASGKFKTKTALSREFNLPYKTVCDIISLKSYKPDEEVE